MYEHGTNTMYNNLVSVRDDVRQLSSKRWSLCWLYTVTKFSFSTSLFRIPKMYHNLEFTEHRGSQ